MYQCSICFGSVYEFAYKCPLCKRWRALQWVDDETGGEIEADPIEVVPMSGVKTAKLPRVSMGNADIALGGGLVPGKVYLLGGEPGVGKSTLILQWAAMVKGTLYGSAEESTTVIQERGNRIGCRDAEILLVATDNLDALALLAKSLAPKLFILDSLQTMQVYNGDYAIGTNQHVMAIGEYLATLKKEMPNTVILAVSHVNGEGSISGPTALEHLVDTVLFLSHGKEENQRTLYASKSRTGPAFISTLFEMSPCGLIEQQLEFP